MRCLTPLMSTSRRLSAIVASELEEAFDIELEPEEIGQMTDFSAVVETVRAKQ